MHIHLREYVNRLKNYSQELNKKVLFLAVTVLFNQFLNAQTVFQKTYGGSGDGGSHIFQTTDGGYIIVGNTDGLGGGFNNIFAMKISSVGNYLWSKTYDASGVDYVADAKQTADGGYVISGLYSPAVNMDMLLMKINSSGALEWTKVYGDSLDDYPAGVQQTADGGYILTGSVSVDILGGNGTCLIKTDMNGDTLWSKIYRDSSNSVGTDVLLSIDDGYIIAGSISVNSGTDSYIIKTDINGQIEWTKSYDVGEYEGADKILQKSNGHYIVSGGATDSTGYNSPYLFEIDTAGNVLWTKTYGGFQHDDLTLSHISSDEGYILFGNTFNYGAGKEDYFLIKTDSIGDTVWTRAYGGSEYDEGGTAIQTNDGGYILVGYTQNFGSGIYIVKTDAFGNSGGCNEFNTSTPVLTSAIIANTETAISRSGIPIANPSFIESGVVMNDSTLCSVIGIHEKTEVLNTIHLYPNPISTFGILHFKNPLRKEHTLVLYNSIGQKVRITGNISNEQIRIEKHHLPQGIYAFQLRNDLGLTGYGKLIIE